MKTKNKNRCKPETDYSQYLDDAYRLQSEKYRALLFGET